jgi:hypothetical protein
MAYRKGTYHWLRRAGFLPAEARELAETSKAGIHAPYFLRMVQSRRGLYLNAIRYKWSDEQYRNVIRADYKKKQAFDVDAIGRVRGNIWKMLRWHEENTTIPEKYESPWRKKIKTNRAHKRQVTYTTRKRMLEDWIAELNTNISKATSEGRKEQLRKQISNLEEQINRINNGI